MTRCLSVFPVPSQGVPFVPNREAVVRSPLLKKFHLRTWATHKLCALQSQIHGPPPLSANHKYSGSHPIVLESQFTPTAIPVMVGATSSWKSATCTGEGQRVPGTTRFPPWAIFSEGERRRVDWPEPAPRGSWIIAELCKWKIDSVGSTAQRHRIANQPCSLK